MSSPEHKKKIWNLIKDIKVAMLMTHSEKLGLHSRPMQLVQDDYDGTLWFFTNVDSEKVFEINNQNEVCLAFSCPKSETYVSMTGYAKLSQNRELIHKFWSPFVDAWFPDGKDSPKVGLIEVKINKGEHWDTDSNAFVQGFKMLKSSVTDEQPDLGENQKFG